MKKIVLIMTIMSFISYSVFFLWFALKPFKFESNKINDLTVSEIYEFLGEPDHNFQIKSFVAWENVKSNILNTIEIRTDFENIDYLNKKPSLIKIQKAFVYSDTKYFSVVKIIDDETVEQYVSIWPFGQFKL